MAVIRLIIPKRNMYPSRALANGIVIKKRRRFARGPEAAIINSFVYDKEAEALSPNPITDARSENSGDIAAAAIICPAS
jgi:hypothetical protein